MAVQMVAALIASFLLRLMFGGKHEFAPVTLPTGSNLQSLVMEFITTFYLVFVIMAVATDDRAVSHACMRRRETCICIPARLRRTYSYVLTIHFLYLCSRGRWLGWLWEQPSCLTRYSLGTYYALLRCLLFNFTA